MYHRPLIRDYQGAGERYLTGAFLSQRPPPADAHRVRDKLGLLPSRPDPDDDDNDNILLSPFVVFVLVLLKVHIQKEVAVV